MLGKLKNLAGQIVNVSLALENYEVGNVRQNIKNLSAGKKTIEGSRCSDLMWGTNR